MVEGDSQVIESSTPGNASAHNGHGVGGVAARSDPAPTEHCQDEDAPHLATKEIQSFMWNPPKILQSCFAFISLTGHFVPCWGTDPVLRPRPHSQRCLLKLQLLRPRVAMEGLVFLLTPLCKPSYARTFIYHKSKTFHGWILLSNKKETCETFQVWNDSLSLIKPVLLRYFYGLSRWHCGDYANGGGGQFGESRFWSHARDGTWEGQRVEKLTQGRKLRNKMGGHGWIRAEEEPGIAMDDVQWVCLD